jgi:hypothetical protein
MLGGNHLKRLKRELVKIGEALMKFLKLVTVLGAIIVAGNANADHGELVGEQLEKLFSGAKTHMRTSRGSSLITTFSANGSARAEIGDSWSSNGNWRVEGGKYCAKWERVRDGNEACFAVIHKSGRVYRFKSIDGVAKSVDVSFISLDEVWTGWARVEGPGRQPIYYGRSNGETETRRQAIENCKTHTGKICAIISVSPGRCGALRLRSGNIRKPKGC